MVGEDGVLAQGVVMVVIVETEICLQVSLFVTFAMIAGLLIVIVTYFAPFTPISNVVGLSLYCYNFMEIVTS